MAEHLNQLCCLIIEDTYGSFLSHIFKQVATYGRLPAGQIAQRCHLLLRQAKAGLATLIQLRLVQHHSVEGFSTYQANLTNAYDLLRTGKLAQLAHAQYGSIAGLVIEVLAAKGFASVKDLEAAVLQALEQSSDRETPYQNGSKASVKVQDTLRRLANDQFMSKLSIGHLQIPHDARQDAEAGHELVTAGGQRGENLRADRLSKVQEEMERRLDTYVSADMIEAALDVPNGEAVGATPQQELYLCLNYVRVIKDVRNATVTQHVNKTLGRTSARLTTAVLKQIELQSPPFERSPNVRTEEQLVVLSRLLDDTRRMPLQNGTHGTNGHHDEDTAMTNGANEDEYLDQEDLESGLDLVSSGPYPFIRRDENTAWWYIDRYQVAIWLRDREILNLISARIGPTGMRLVRMLIDKGKLDEKLLQEMGLLSAKEMRQALAELQTMGLTELQEVPREPQRQPNRTIFLWFYDALRARDLLLGQLYKSMARCYQRLQVVERERMRATLDKIERDDVKDRIEEVVVGAEKVALEQFQAKERWLMGEIARLDESVALLRDM
ncbi:uncharacterized protein HMPREF1541_10979 [Cyphellophora europaea CBS 101466]|uniref:DNA-directed RNA polymerase III subunit RPC3 n=1 Tax=Cyphellophora europaea (strain CBS 101466) TaxID=1220924 RepID=W2S725_CYPE1|nr:uncharacterized protein HMPREF1541_10979 [Cyphellophora europaea CBS 101466]ETN43848.1 hypothetical protein HMPREF1541_10979 [Cyphellophora europaea CBS 101466]